MFFPTCDRNPHADLQAQDRCHRIGQKKKVRHFIQLASEAWRCPTAVSRNTPPRPSLRLGHILARRRIGVIGIVAAQKAHDLSHSKYRTSRQRAPVFVAPQVLVFRLSTAGTVEEKARPSKEPNACGRCLVGCLTLRARAVRTAFHLRSRGASAA